MEIAESTKSSYRSNARLLLEQFARSNDQPFEPMAFCNWLAATKFPLAAATWRVYRASALFYIEEHFPLAHSQCSEYLAMFSSHNKPKGIIRTKQKGYSETDFSALLTFIKGRIVNPRTRGSGKIWWENLYFTLIAGDLVGLRPCEWGIAPRIDIYEGQCNLVIDNAKTTRGRAHGPTRTINITKLSEAEVSAIQKKIELTADAIALGLCKNMNDYQKRTREYLLLANNAVFPNADKTIAAYSTRHQVVSEYKSTEGNTKEGLAAILGHRSTETAGKHYGRKRSGKGKLKPSKLQADPGDQKRVAACNAHRDAGPRGPRQKPPTPPPRPSGPSM
jgi:hypothetical protein